MIMKNKLQKGQNTTDRIPCNFSWHCSAPGIRNTRFSQLITEVAGDQLTMNGLSTGRGGGQLTSGSSLGGLRYDMKLCFVTSDRKRKSASTHGNTYVALTHVYMHNVTRKDEHVL